jgi:hypothetical protein
MSKVSLIENIVGGQEVSDIRIANLSECINMYIETQGDGASATTLIRSINGSTKLTDVDRDNRRCRGIFEASRGADGFPVLFAVFGPRLYCITNVDGQYVATEIYSSLTNTDEPVSMCETGGEGSAHPHLIVVDGANVIACNTELSPEDMRDPSLDGCRSIALPYRVRQDDPEQPTQRIIPTHCAYLYGYLVVNDAGTDAFYTSYQYPFERNEMNNENAIDYDIFMINSTHPTEVGYKDYGFVTYSEWSPDNTTALVSNSTLLYTFGPKSTQIFTYNSDVEAPFVSPTNAANSIGIKAVRSLACVGDYVFYLGASAIGENGIYYWRANQLTKISTPDIERHISKMKNPSDAVGQCWTESGHMFYALTFYEDDYTYVYDILEQKWHRRSSKAEKTNIQHYWRLLFATLHDSKIMFGTEDGKLVYLDPNKYEEYDGRPMVRIRRSGMMMNNYQDYIVNSVRLIANLGDFDNANLNPKIMMRYAESGGNFSNQEIGMLGNQGRYDWVLEWWRLGLHNICCLEFSCSDPVNFAILGAKISYDLIDRF